MQYFRWLLYEIPKSRDFFYSYHKYPIFFNYLFNLMRGYHIVINKGINKGKHKNRVNRGFMRHPIYAYTNSFLVMNIVTETEQVKMFN
jgi:hypothetical protein